MFTKLSNRGSSIVVIIMWQVADGQLKYKLKPQKWGGIYE